MVVNRPSVAPADCQCDDSGDLELTKWCYRFDSCLVLGTLRVQERHV